MDGLIGMCANELSRNPRSGAAFVFCNKSQKGIKVPYYDRQAGKQAGRQAGLLALSKGVFGRENEKLAN
jgi:hypothetical protein